MTTIKRLRLLRRQFGLTQRELARRTRAANKAVVYPWESRKRRPSPVFWKRMEALGRGESMHAVVRFRSSDQRTFDRFQLVDVNNPPPIGEGRIPRLLDVLLGPVDPLSEL
jgi:transcriptional regulator with XRE-family HTH domain